MHEKGEGNKVDRVDKVDKGDEEMPHGTLYHLYLLYHLYSSPTAFQTKALHAAPTNGATINSHS